MYQIAVFLIPVDLNVMLMGNSVQVHNLPDNNNIISNNSQGILFEFDKND